MVVISGVLGFLMIVNMLDNDEYRYDLGYFFLFAVVVRLIT